MRIRPATKDDFAAVRAITRETISEVYPHYYPRGAVAFFLRHHSDAQIREDLAAGRVFLCLDEDQNAVGTVTVRDNEICRLSVLPRSQGRGYGRALLDFAEETVAASCPEIVVDASLPAKRIYRKRGYVETDYHVVATGDGDYLCYDVMKKRV